MSNIPYSFAISCVATKVNYPGGYPGGFLEMARSVLAGANDLIPIVHVCGGMAHTYNNTCNWGYGPNDARIDLDPAVKPGILFDVRDMSKVKIKKSNAFGQVLSFPETEYRGIFNAAIIDRDYNIENAAKHATGVETWPSNLSKLTKESFVLVRKGGLIGVLDFDDPGLPNSGYKQLFYVSVRMPGAQRNRQFTVWQER